MTLRRVAALVAWVSLVATLWPAIAFFRGTMELAELKPWMLGATIAWFVAATIGLDRDRR